MLSTTLLFMCAVPQAALAEGGTHAANGTNPVLIRSEGERTLLGVPRGRFLGRPIVVDDVDGDGYGELLLPVGESSSGARGSLRLLSGRTFEPLVRVGGEAHFSLDHEAGQILVLAMRRPRAGSLELRTRLGSRPRWRRDFLESPIGPLHRARFAGDANRDGHADVVATNAWAFDPHGLMTGAVALLSGEDGRALWTRFGWEDGEGYGFDVAKAGDHDQDGVADVAVLAMTVNGRGGPDHIAILSGTDGAPLLELDLPGECRRSFELEGLGDLDGDGLGEWLLYRSRDSAIVLSTLSRAPLDLLGPDWSLLWAASGGDLDGDGADDLVLGRVDPATGEGRISLWSRGALLDVGFPDQRDPASVPDWTAERGWIGHVDPGRRWSLVLFRERREIDYRSEVIVVPGPVAR